VNKGICGLFAIAVVCAGCGKPKLSFIKHYKVGDVYAYHMNMTSSGQMAVNLDSDVKMTVKKVYDNGDADIDIQQQNGKMTLGGKSMDMPDSAQGTQHARLTNKGVPADSSGSGALAMNIPGMGGLVPNNPMSVGDVFQVNQNEKDGTTVTGTMKLDSITGGIAHLTADLSVGSKIAPQPVQIHAIMLVDAADNTLESEDADISSNGPGGKGHISLKRIKS